MSKWPLQWTSGAFSSLGVNWLENEDVALCLLWLWGERKDFIKITPRKKSSVDIVLPVPASSFSFLLLFFFSSSVSFLDKVIDNSVVVIAVFIPKESIPDSIFLCVVVFFSCIKPIMEPFSVVTNSVFCSTGSPFWDETFHGAFGDVSFCLFLSNRKYTWFSAFVFQLFSLLYFLFLSSSVSLISQVFSLGEINGKAVVDITSFAVLK